MSGVPRSFDQSWGRGSIVARSAADWLSLRAGDLVSAAIVPGFAAFTAPTGVDGLSRPCKICRSAAWTIMRDGPCDRSNCLHSQGEVNTEGHRGERSDASRLPSSSPPAPGSTASRNVPAPKPRGASPRPATSGRQPIRRGRPASRSRPALVGSHRPGLTGTPPQTGLFIARRVPSCGPCPHPAAFTDRGSLGRAADTRA